MESSNKNNGNETENTKDNVAKRILKLIFS
jgi:hypothetical protein